jgi:TM2 domain-containing membrane protein YozV
VSNRITDASAIEARLLELAHTTEAKITAPALAYFAPCSIDDAGRVLDDLAARDRLHMEIEDDGTVVYQMPGRQKLAGPPAPPASPLAPALVRMARPVRGPSPALAGLLSALVPGAGHLYAERPVAAILWFLVVSLGYTLIVPGLVLHLFSIAAAASSARRLEAARARPLLASFTMR